MCYDPSRPQHVQEKYNVEEWEYKHPNEKITRKMSQEERVDYREKTEAECIARDRQKHPSRNTVYYKKER